MQIAEGTIRCSWLREGMKVQYIKVRTCLLIEQQSACTPAEGCMQQMHKLIKLCHNPIMILARLKAPTRARPEQLPPPAPAGQDAKGVSFNLGYFDWVSRGLFDLPDPNTALKRHLQSSTVEVTSSACLLPDFLHILCGRHRNRTMRSGKAYRG